MNKPRQSSLPTAFPAIVRATRLGPQLLDCGRTRAYQISKTEGFPRPIVLGGKARGYIVAEVQEWLAKSAPRA